MFINMHNGSLALHSFKKYKVKVHGSVQRNVKYQPEIYTLGKECYSGKKGKRCAWFVSQWLFGENQSLELPGSRVILSMATESGDSAVTS